LTRAAIDETFSLHTLRRAIARRRGDFYSGERKYVKRIARITRLLIVLLMVVSAAVVVDETAAMADDAVFVGQDSDGNPIYLDQSETDPSEPADLPTDSPYPDLPESTSILLHPLHEICDASHSTTVSNLPNKLSVDYRDSMINDTGLEQTLSVTATKSTTFTWGLSVTVGVEAKAWIFAKVSASVNGSIQHSSTTTFGSTATARVPAHSIIKADRGMWQEKFGYKYYSINGSCKETHGSGTGQAPYRQYWRLYS
jgi:hypothetical protein